MKNYLNYIHLSGEYEGKKVSSNILSKPELFIHRQKVSARFNPLMKLCSNASCPIARPEHPAHPYPRDPTLVTTKLALAAAGDGTNSANRNV